jgi:hypothetical protein
MTYPRLTDISTDTDDPPEFIAAISDRPADAAPIVEALASEIEMQREAYPDIVPRHYPVDTVRVFDAEQAVVARRGWRVLASIRDGDGALVDMRSAARNGAHDLGADAERIRAFFKDLDDGLQGIGGADVTN